MDQEANDNRGFEVGSGVEGIGRAADAVTLSLQAIETADDQGPVGGLRSGYTQAVRQVGAPNFIPSYNDNDEY